MKRKLHFSQWYDKIVYLLWGLLFILLPITSLPAISRLAGGTMVALPSFFPMAVLVLVWLIPWLFKVKTLPGHFLPLLGFASIAVLATAFSFFIDIPSFKNASIIKNAVEGIVTLGIGVVFYILVSTWAAEQNRLRSILKWINWGGILIILYGMLQFIVFQMNNEWPGWIDSLQKTISVGDLYRERVTSFALEPSWLIHQLNMLYLPFWMAAVFYRSSVFKKLPFGIMVEDILLVFGCFMLIATRSRIGLLGFLLAGALFVWMISQVIVKWLKSRQKTEKRKKTAALVYYLVVIFAIVVVLSGLVYYMMNTDSRMGELLNLDAISEKSLAEYAEPLAFAPRIIYWQAGWNIFNEYPILGVGLNNAGQYFPEKIDPFGWQLIEVRQYMYQFSSSPNIKSFWFRLLAETGILGFGSWLIWYILMGLTSRELNNKGSGNIRIIGLAGLFTLLAFIMEGLSIDSFALPYLWISMGLVTGAWKVFQSSTTSVNEKQSVVLQDN